MPKKPIAKKIKGGLTKIEKGSAYVLCVKPENLVTQEMAEALDERDKLMVEYFKKHGAELMIVATE
jgi:hypothetical protein